MCKKSQFGSTFQTAECKPCLCLKSMISFDFNPKTQLTHFQAKTLYVDVVSDFSQKLGKTENRPSKLKLRKISKLTYEYISEYLVFVYIHVYKCNDNFLANQNILNFLDHMGFFLVHNHLHLKFSNRYGLSKSENTVLNFVL